MPFECPACRAPAGLEITLSLELPPDSRSAEGRLETDEIVVAFPMRLSGK